MKTPRKPEPLAHAWVLGRGRGEGEEVFACCLCDLEAESHEERRELSRTVKCKENSFR